MHNKNNNNNKCNYSPPNLFTCNCLSRLVLISEMANNTDMCLRYLIQCDLTVDDMTVQKSITWTAGGDHDPLLRPGRQLCELYDLFTSKQTKYKELHEGFSLVRVFITPIQCGLLLYLHTAFWMSRFYKAFSFLSFSDSKLAANLIHDTAYLLVWQWCHTDKYNLKKLNGVFIHRD